MIISASYKTDIPAFYGTWFLNRLDAGTCRMRNPYGGQVYEVPLDLASVDGFVFWTRNAGPFLPVLREVRRRGYPFAVQYTVTGYGRPLELSVPGPEKMVEIVRRLAGEFGPRAVVWRYDPILISSATPPSFHLRQFERLAVALAGATDEVTVSFAQFYRKTERNLASLARKAGLSWDDPAPDQKQELLSSLAKVATLNGMRLTLCAQPRLTGVAPPARCIDAGRLGDIAGHAIKAEEKGNRPGCLCHRSRDIGAYDSCPHGCLYCYAVSSQKAAQARFRRHDPDGPFLADNSVNSTAKAAGAAATLGRADKS